VALPAHLTIPAIGGATDLVRLGLQPDRTVEVPADADRAGWFEEGPAPGQTGSSVVLGHVDSAAGPAVFHRLAELGPGDRILVRMDDGSVARFAVRRVATYANADFPAQEVYAGSPGQPALNLVTCGGWYDAARGGWQGNVVVFTALLPPGRT
jgi:sortase (surface protein transpeptidase)